MIYFFAICIRFLNHVFFMKSVSFKIQICYSERLRSTCNSHNIRIGHSQYLLLSFGQSFIWVLWLPLGQIVSIISDNFRHTKSTAFLIGVFITFLKNSEATYHLMGYGAFSLTGKSKQLYYSIYMNVSHICVKNSSRKSS